MAGVIAVSSVLETEATYNKAFPTLTLHIDSNGRPVTRPKHSPIRETVLARAERKSSANAKLTQEVDSALATPKFHVLAAIINAFMIV